MVGVPQYPAYRYHEHFTHADEFIPERWLDPAKYEGEGLPSFADDCREVLKPFMYGPRNCIGENIAWAEMRAVLAKLTWSFDFKCAGGLSNPDEGWKWENQRTFATWERQNYEVEIQVRK
jgi:cytochrome P450